MNLKLYHAHPWSVSPKEAVQIQNRLAPLVTTEPLSGDPATIAGVDMSVRGDRVQAAVVVMSYPDLEVVDEAIWRGPVEFPYIPGLLSFREVPAVIKALEQIQERPALLMTDSQGIAHPRRLGLASHLGVLLDMPAVGVAKSRLTGHPQAELNREKGAQVPLIDREEVIGAVVRTRTDVKPLFVSIGHRIELTQAVAYVLATTTRYRLPEPTRQAHLLSRRQDPN